MRGCSHLVGSWDGVRQGLKSTQRFPELFDGVVTMTPAMRISEGATIAAAWTVQRFAAVAAAGAECR